MSNSQLPHAGPRTEKHRCRPDTLLPLNLSEPDEVAARECFGNTFAQLLAIVGVAATGWLVEVAGTYSALFVLTAIMSAAGALILELLYTAAADASCCDFAGVTDRLPDTVDR